MRVAIVDDSSIVRRMMEQQLKSFGHEPFPILPTAVFDVLKNLKESQTELVIVDLNMPDCPGLSLIRAVREDPQLASLPVLVNSSYIDETTVYCLQRLKVNAVASKPTNLQDLELQVKKALDGTLWAPSPKQALIALIDDVDSRRSRIADLILEADLQSLQLASMSCFDLMAALLDTPPILVVIALPIQSCPVVSLIRLIREDSRLGQTPILICSTARHSITQSILDRFEVYEMQESTLTPARIFEAIQATLDNLKIPKQSD